MIDYCDGLRISGVSSDWHLFYQQVMQPLADLAKRAMSGADADDVEGGDKNVAESTRKALLGLELMLLSLARAQTEMEIFAPSEEKSQLFKNLRKSWSAAMDTQFLHL